MKFKENFLMNYISNSPISLALERAMECEILSHQEFARPILDIGCGDGLFAYNLFDEQIDTGIEPNTKELERAKELNCYHELINCNGDNIPKKDGIYNTVFSNSVLEHIEPLDPVLKEVHRLLSKNGYFYATLPTNKFDQYTIVNQILIKIGLKSTARKYRSFFNNFWKHYQYYSPEEWGQLFERIGFRVVECVEYGPKKTCLVNDFFMPFSFCSLVTKKLFNRWILFPSWRKVYLFPLYYISSKSLKKSIGVHNGGLVFFKLKKI
ncbi:MAG: class I SAM-dependent methyltransferase [Candidatus Methanoperedens sp.]